MKEAFKDPRISGKVMTMIRMADEILAEYRNRNMVMTLRQLHYQLVSRFPAYYPNTQSSYKKLTHAMTVGRLAGWIDWTDLEDTLRDLDAIPTWDDPSEIIEGAANAYRIAFWQTQDYAPELWVEKDALARVVGIACRELRVPVFACRGYVSQSAQYVASKRFQDAIAEGRTPIIFHMGDHDPSGLDMTNNNENITELLTGEPVEVRRIALNMDQVRQYNPPPNPAKEKDSRFAAYRRRFGVHSWELDALTPDVLNELVRTNIRPLIDALRWERSVDEETRGRDLLRLASERWLDIVEFLERADNDET
jgi:hypothetical protein